MSLVTHYIQQMATRQKHRIAGKPYNLRRKVEIPVELQVQDDGAFLNEFSSQQPWVNPVWRKLVMHYSYVKWGKVKLLAGLKQETN